MTYHDINLLEFFGFQWLVPTLFVSICCLLHLLMGCHVFTLSGLRSVPDDLHPIAVLPARPEDHTDGRGQPAMARLK